ncbi:MAG: peptidoglycan DD-metalloendopeptidase family protein [Candidatus Pacebacteria bacterium]|nr:peptidoglycan DD-metalloendopeptidase family protein [Candidatus Paceibacterota bacterium]
MKKSFIIFILSLFIIPIFAFASEGYWGTQWQRNSSFSRKVDKLDDDPVEKIPIPVLFGIDLGNVPDDFGAPRGGGTRSHEGIDFLVPTGTPIISPTEAVVRNIGVGNSAGNYVYTVNPGGEVFAYMHLHEIARGLEPGDELDPGDFIGTVGYSGNAVESAPHLHFEIQVDGEAIDPHHRVAKEFDLEEKMEFLDEVFDTMNSSDDDDLAELMLSVYRDEIQEAEDEDIDLPKEIEEAQEDLNEKQEEFFENLDEGDIDCNIRYTRLIRLWSRGEDVKDVQRCMNSLGFSTGVVDGIYGPNTYAGITAYQRNAGLKYIDGIVGPETSSALNRL